MTISKTKFAVNDKYIYSCIVNEKNRNEYYLLLLLLWIPQLAPTAFILKNI